jgi:phosphocarrier protein
LSQRASCTVKIKNRLGLHARPAMMFVDAASTARCEVTVKGNGEEVDGKSIMQMMMLAATKGVELEIIAVGDDAQATVEMLRDLVNSGFGED